MTTGEKKHGFTVEHIRPAEVGGTMIEMTHDKTGAHLIWLRNEEENKLFSITFKTVPSDDTGVFHILEHSVLAGSKRYPVKAPFLELMKSSMNTFLNAMTFPDKTVFPVSSRNQADFMNLTRVYLDAVFNPAIYENPCIFEQEGWHIECRSPEDTPLYKGVVFNEMKGAMSSVERRIWTEMGRLLFPDTCYGYESGGDPEAIPNLTYEQFLRCHRYFYHPSNSYIYLDGSLDIDAVLELLDTEYLSRYDRSGDSYAIQEQAQILPAVRRCEYEIAPEEPTEKRTQLAVGKMLARWHEREKVVAAAALAEALAGSNEAPLKRALLDTGLCVDVSMDVEDGILQPFWLLRIRNTDEADCDRLLETVRETVRRFTEQGIDRGALSAAISRLEFRTREGSEPKGLLRCLQVLASWIYGGDPLLYVGCDDVFAFLREQLDTRYYEDLLAEWLLDENGRAVLYMVPSRTYGEKLRENEAQRLRTKLETVSQEALLEANRRLDAWHQSEDTAEQLATLPRLPLAEVSERPIRFTTDVTEAEGIPVLRHPAREKGITAVNLYFTLADCTEQDLFDLALMTELFGNLPTARTSGAALRQNMTALLGDIRFDVEAFGRANRPDTCRPFFTVQFRFLDSNLDAALSLVGEILTETVFDTPEQVRELLMQSAENLRQSLIEAGHRFAIGRAGAALSSENSVRELTSGYETYKRLHALLQTSDNDLPGRIRALEALQARILCRARLTVGTTAFAAPSLSALLARLPQGGAAACAETHYRLQTPAAQGIRIPAAVSYSAAALPGAHDMAAWRVLCTVLSLEYLWNEIRVKGGAYGTGALIGAQGQPSYYSYRDPAPGASLAVYDRAADFVRSYCAQPLPEQYIISTVAKQEPLLSDSAMGTAAEALYLRGITEEDRCAERRRMLALRSEDLLAAAEALTDIRGRCVIGPAEALDRCDAYGLAVENAD